MIYGIVKSGYAFYFLKLRELNIGDFKDLAEILQDKNVVYAYEHDFSDRDVHEWMERQFNR